MPVLQHHSINGMLSTIASVMLGMALLCLAEFAPAQQEDAQQESAVGTTQGELQVDRQGAMNYNIPLTLPRAPAGFQPSLFLSYRSGTKEGLLGQGWQLQGLTLVHRCPGIPAVHGKHKAVTFSQDDVLCIDGNFLVSINDDEYRTAIESFARIQRIDDGFEVLTKTGIHLYYG
ncbi:MAG: SpvB/TcaC N-terminal domain-containing protein, partial [Candidatus Oxydemutatoraceae bacterium WSBS_2016_MAG_OTU14]